MIVRLQFLLAKGPATARGLDEEERAWLVERQRALKASAEKNYPAKGKLFCKPRRSQLINFIYCGLR